MPTPPLPLPSLSPPSLFLPPLPVRRQTDDSDHRCCSSGGAQVKMNAIKQTEELQSVDQTSMCVVSGA